jgi:deoxyribodipyrimidine photo-lyase
MLELYLFNNDLRLADNPGLLAHVQAEELLCVYCWPGMPPWCNLTGIGAQRERFLRECLAELDQDLRALGQRLLLLETDPRTAIPQLVELFGIDRAGTSVSAGYYERQQQQTLAKQLPIEFLVHPGNTLFSESQLVAPLESLPKQFTPFRKQVENLAVPTPRHAPEQLPPPPAGVSFPRLAPTTARPHPSFPVRGGSREGKRRLQHWMFERQLICNYKETRNNIDGLDGCSVLSPWLATGALSAREVANQLFEFEQTILKNDSTEWLYQELLWREFFHWRAHIDGQLLFQAGGILGEKKHLRTFEARDFARWCQGQTDVPLVNAFMHQLVSSGWMSNRGRQIVASYLVNELNHDWRYGAAFFEKHLIDYDVSSNYGNWQYIAGVGTDPRGGRHFNTAKQTALYDPEGLFCRKWDGYQPTQPRHITDAADWPIPPRER